MVNNWHLLRLRKASCIIWSNCFWDLITVILLPPSFFCTASKIRRWEVCVHVCPCMFLLSTWDKEAVIRVRGSHHYPRDPCSWQGLVPSWKEAISPVPSKGREGASQGQLGTREGCAKGVVPLYSAFKSSWSWSPMIFPEFPMLSAENRRQVVWSCLTISTKSKGISQ